MSVKASIKFGLMYLSLVLVCGCAGHNWPDISSKEKKPDQAYSNDEVRRITVDQPFLLSGDYFREREHQPESQIGLFKKDEEKAQAQKKKKEKKTAEETDLKAKSLKRDYGLRLKCGFYWEAEAVSASLAPGLEDFLVKSAPKEEFALVKKAAIKEVLASAGCNDDTECWTRNLRVYPGLRFLLYVQSARAAKSFPGEAAFRVQPLDLQAGTAYPSQEFKAQVKDKQGLQTFFAKGMDKVWGYCQEKSKTMPWVCRVFSVKGGKIYLSAGKKSGLAKGSELKLVSGGEMLTSPTGLPVEWLPGEIKGAVKVKKLLGQDYASAEVIDGKRPEIGDILIIKQK